MRVHGRDIETARALIRRHGPRAANAAQRAAFRHARHGNRAGAFHWRRLEILVTCMRVEPWLPDDNIRKLTAPGSVPDAGGA